MCPTTQSGSPPAHGTESAVENDLCQTAGAVCRLWGICRGKGQPFRVKKNDTVFFAGLRSKFVYLLHDGVVGLFRLWESGEESIVTVLAPGSIFGLTSLMEGPLQQQMVHFYHAVALTPGVVCKTKKSTLETELRGDPDAAMQVIQLLLERISDLERLGSVPATHRVQKRLISLLLLLAEKFGNQTDDGVQLTVPFSHQDLAYMASSSRATITRELQSLRSEGLITVTGRSICIPDQSALADMLE